MSGKSHTLSMKEVFVWVDFVLETGLTMEPRLALNLQSSCLHLPPKVNAATPNYEVL
jgi:hypothetical protein